MATLTLSIGPLTSTLQATDANAQRVLGGAFALFHQNEEEPKTYTSKEKLDWIVRVLIPQMLVDKAAQYEEAVAIREAQKAAREDAPILE